jgi:hypothetical protein
MIGVLLVIFQPPLNIPRERSLFWLDPWKPKYNENRERINTIVHGFVMILFGVLGIIIDLSSTQ